MRRLKRLAHAVWECKYHVVWCPKFRFRILQGQISKSLGDIIEQLCEWKKIEILASTIQLDHVHLVLCIPPKHSVSAVVGFLKGKSAIKIFDRHMDLRKRYWGRHFWAQGYCVSTVGLDEEKVKQYVLWQLNRDRNTEEPR